MRSCSMALQLLSTALGSYLGGGVVAIVQAASSRAGAPWLPKDLNQGASIKAACSGFGGGCSSLFAVSP